MTINQINPLDHALTKEALSDTFDSVLRARLEGVLALSSAIAVPSDFRLGGIVLG